MAEVKPTEANQDFSNEVLRYHSLLILLELNCHILRESNPFYAERPHGWATCRAPRGQLRCWDTHKSGADSRKLQPSATKSSPVFPDEVPAKNK